MHQSALRMCLTVQKNTIPSLFQYFQVLVNFFRSFPSLVNFFRTCSQFFRNTDPENHQFWRHFGPPALPRSKLFDFFDVILVPRHYPGVNFSIFFDSYWFLSFYINIYYENTYDREKVAFTRAFWHQKGQIMWEWTLLFYDHTCFHSPLGTICPQI